MRSGISVQAYAALSLVAGIVVVLNTWMQHEQFYPTLVALSSSKSSLFIIGNVAVAACIFMAMGVKAFFLGSLRENEFEHLSEKAYPMLLDLLLTVTLFRTSLSVSFFAMLGALVASKCFHWLVNKRVEYMGQFPMTPMSHYVRLGVFMVLLLALDVLVVVKSVSAVIIDTKGFTTLFSSTESYEGPSIHVLYGFEFSLLATMMTGSIIHSALILWELLRHEGSWDSKSTYLMYADFFADVIQFVLYILFFLTLYAYVGLPITLLRPLLVAFGNFRKRVADLLRYREATQNMEQRFPEATAEELEGAHNMCIICREEMTQGRKLPCGHVLHLRCLREWLEHQQTCPTCRVPVLDTPANVNQRAQEQRQNQNAQNAANPFAFAANNNPFGINNAQYAQNQVNRADQQQQMAAQDAFANQFNPHFAAQQAGVPPAALYMNGHPVFNYFYGLGPFGPMQAPQAQQQQNGAQQNLPQDPFAHPLAPHPFHHPYAMANAQNPWFQPPPHTPDSSATISTSAQTSTAASSSSPSPSVSNTQQLDSNTSEETHEEINTSEIAPHSEEENQKDKSSSQDTSSRIETSKNSETESSSAPTSNLTPYESRSKASSSVATDSRVSAPSSPAPFAAHASPISIPDDVASDISELSSGIYRDLDSLRARMDVLSALLQAHGISSPSAPQ